MAMSGDMLGMAIGTAFYNTIPGNIISCMKPEDRVTMCNTLIQNSKNHSELCRSPHYGQCPGDCKRRYSSYRRLLCRSYNRTWHRHYRINLT